MLIYFFELKGLSMNIGIERSIQSCDLLTLAYVLIFFLIVFTRLKFPKKFSALSTSFFSKTFFVDYATELSATISVFKITLFIIQNLVFSILMYNFYIAHSQNTVGDFLLFFQIFGGISLFLVFQYFLGLLIAKVFNFTELYKSIHALKFSYLKVISFLLLPFLLFQNYGLYHDKNLVSVIIALFFVVLMLLRFVLVVVQNNKILFERLYYFIVYLCTLEIVPLLIVYKLLVNK